jgi:hypothetical protein
MTAYSQVSDQPELVRNLDRCDRCGSEAFVRVVLLATGLPLLFCAHHYAEQADALRAVAVVTHDERAMIQTGWAALDAAR